MFLYQLRNTVSGNRYYGIAKSPKQRYYTHRHAMKSGTKSKLYDAMRSYVEEAFVLEILEEGSEEYIANREVELIASDSSCYNLHRGGHIGFSMTKHGKTPEEIQEWRERLRQGRKGKTPALGMQHTEETKKLCGAYGKLRWDIHGRYNAEEVIALRCVDAMRKFGISKTHYYRLRKAAAK